MKEIKVDNTKNNYTYYIIEPNDIEGVNIGGLVAIPKGELKTNKLLTILQEDKYKSTFNDRETGEDIEIKTTEDAVKRLFDNVHVDKGIEELKLDGQVVLMPMLPNDERIKESFNNDEKDFSGIFLSRECYTDIPKDNRYYRLDEQLSKMMQTVIKENNLEKASNIFGHSTSGLAAMRFSMTQPQMVDNLIIGGNADEVPTPIGENASKLDYPFGIKDYENLFGKKFDENQFKSIHFRYYIAEYECADPNLDGIRDENYGIRANGEKSSGVNFAPEDISRDYKKIYDNGRKTYETTCTYERLSNVLEQYEKNGLDMKFKIYDKGCHTQINAEDIYDAQFKNGQNFENNGSEILHSAMKKVEQLEQFAQKNPDNPKAKKYNEISNKIKINNEFQDKEKRLEAIIDLENEVLKQQTIEEKNKIKEEPELNQENYHSKKSYFQDQKSDLYFTEQKIGKATVNTPTKNKDKAYDKVLNKVHERTHPEEIHEHTMGPQSEM